MNIRSIGGSAGRHQAAIQHCTLPYRKFNSFKPFHIITVVRLPLQLYYQSRFLVSLKLCQEIQFKSCCFKIDDENKLDSLFRARYDPALATPSTVLSAAASQWYWRVGRWMLWTNLDSISLRSKSHCQHDITSYAMGKVQHSYEQRGYLLGDAMDSGLTSWPLCLVVFLGNTLYS